jgi:hypothetical protein
VRWGFPVTDFAPTFPRRVCVCGRVLQVLAKRGINAATGEQMQDAIDVALLVDEMARELRANTPVGRAWKDIQVHSCESFAAGRWCGARLVGLTFCEGTLCWATRA